MEVKPVQPSKHECPNLVTDDGIVMEVKPVQPSKQPFPISVTDEGMVMEVKPVQPSKPFKDVTEEGIVMEVKPVHSKYLQPIITQYFIDNKSEIWLLFLIAHSKR
mgnify:CR=1 FL=1